MESLKDFKEKVEYFNNLYLENLKTAKTKNDDKEREESVFHNINISSDGSEITFYIDKDDYFYTMYKDGLEKYCKKIKEGIKEEWHTTKEGLKYRSTTNEDIEALHYAIALSYIDKLMKYSNKEITFEELAGIRKETKQVVKDILKQKNNISEQLKLLRSNRNIPEVQEYIDYIYNDKYCSKYVRYLIDKYYYNKKDLEKPKKTALDSWGKLLLD